MTYSKLLNEYLVVANVNDRIDVDQVGAPATNSTITLTPGRYRDAEALATEIQTQLNALAWGTWTVAVNDSTGIVTITCDEDWDVDWVVSSYGTTLRNDLGFSGSEGVDGSYILTGTSQHVGGFYPTEPVEADGRPDEDGLDTWGSDTYQQMGRTGVLTTKGGDNLVYDRTITFLLPQADLTAFSNWLARCAQGYSFAFYHDRTQTWTDAAEAGETYQEYKLQGEGEAGIRYEPERVDPANTIWHRATVVAIKRVAATP